MKIRDRPVAVASIRKNKWDQWGAGYLVAGSLWQGYVAVSLISLDVQTFHAPIYPELFVFAVWSALPAMVAAIVAWLWPGRSGYWRRFARWFFWLGLPVTAGSIFLAV